MIILRSSREIEQLRKANAIVAEVLEKLRKAVAPGVATSELDQITEDVILSRGAIPAFKGYRGFPRSACISINEQVVHGIPDSRKLREGDIVSIDVGTNLRGYFGDAAITLPVGEVDRQGKALLEVTEKPSPSASRKPGWGIGSLTSPMRSKRGWSPTDSPW